MDYPSGLDDSVNFVIKEYTKDDTPRSPAKFLYFVRLRGAVLVGGARDKKETTRGQAEASREQG